MSKKIFIKHTFDCFGKDLTIRLGKEELIDGYDSYLKITKHLNEPSAKFITYVRNKFKAILNEQKQKIVSEFTKQRKQEFKQQLTKEVEEIYGKGFEIYTII
jgi:hypothetical protein